MLDNDNIMTAKASEVVQKVPTDEKDYYKCSLCVIVYIKPQHTSVSIFSRKGTSSVAKRNSRRHFKICTEKGAITGP